MQALAQKVHDRDRAGICTSCVVVSIDAAIQCIGIEGAVGVGVVV